MPPLTDRAFAELYERAARPLWTYVYRVTGRAADADDIVQDAFCRMLNADVADLTSDEQRPEPPARPPAAADEEVAATFRQLKPRERALLWLGYVEQHSHDEIAAALGIGRASVKVLLARARVRLRQLLQADGPSRGGS